MQFSARRRCDNFWRNGELEHDLLNEAAPGVAATLCAPKSTTSRRRNFMLERRRAAPSN